MAGGTAYQKQANGSLVQLNPIRQHLGGGEVATIVISSIGDTQSNTLEPLPPTINTSTSVMTSRTAATINWSAPNNTGRPPITNYLVYRETNGISTLAGTVGPSTLTLSVTGLPTATPEVIFRWTVVAVNADGPSLPSNIWTSQWSATPLNQPAAVTSQARSPFSEGTQANTGQTTLTWSMAADATVTKLGIFEGTTLVRDNLSPTATSYIYDNLPVGSVHTNVNVRRFNGWSTTGTTAGWSAAGTPQLSFTVTVPPVSLMMIGCSSSNNDHGGTEVWDGWRVYTRSEMEDRADRTGAQRPKYLAYSKNGSPFSGSYASVRSEVLADLNTFYYTGGASSQTHSARWGIKLYWSNGNENSDKGVLATQSAANLATFTDGQRALYDACHFIDPTTNQRRFPDALAGSNPTQVHEFDGIVAWWLLPTAQYHDFVMWSMYPAGRGVNDPSLSRNPRWDWPSFNEAQRTSRQQGFLIRCYYRTALARDQARIDTGDPTRQLIIATGEQGMASDPDDRATRPYYAVHGMIGSQYRLAAQYSLPQDFSTWWDNVTKEQGDTNASSVKPHNILTDEPPNSDHLNQGGGGAAGNNATATNPSTMQAIKNWRQYDKRIPGSSQPAQWAGKPGNIDNQTGTPI